MEPLTIAIVSGAVGATAGKFVEKAWGLGEKWLEHYTEGHLPKAKENAKQNSLKFLNDVAQRIQQLEEGAQEDQQIKEKIISALEGPDFSLLLQDALYASARTDNEDKHKILARIVSERLLSQPDDLVTLTSTLACEAVKHLAPKHMRYLALATFVYFIRPHKYPEVIFQTEHPELAGSFYTEWLERHLSFILPIEPMRQRDFSHLESVSCLRKETLITRNLLQLMTPPVEQELDWSLDEFINNNTGQQLKEIWEGGMDQITLTSAGNLIGIYVHDELSGKRTILINW